MSSNLYVLICVPAGKDAHWPETRGYSVHFDTALISVANFGDVLGGKLDVCSLDDKNIFGVL